MAFRNLNRTVDASKPHFQQQLSLTSWIPTRTHIAKFLALTLYYLSNHRYIR